MDEFEKDIKDLKDIDVKDIEEKSTLEDLPKPSFKPKKPSKNKKNFKDDKAPKTSPKSPIKVVEPKKSSASSASVLIQGSGAKFRTGTSNLVPSGAYVGQDLQYGGMPTNPIVAGSGIPTGGGHRRPDSREGKKSDLDRLQIDNIYSEQVEVEYLESKKLSESADSLQGYNGTYLPTKARSKKIVGTVPSNLLFDRSLDIIMKDKIYFANGQLLTNADSFDEFYAAADFAGATKGNFIPRYMNVTFNADGTIQAMNFEVDDLDGLNVDPRVLEGSNDNILAERNRILSDIERLQVECGDETKSNWSPLARAISHPKETLSLFKDMDVSTSSEIAMAYRKLSHAHAYQYNKATKDGNITVRPMAEMCLNDGNHIPAYNISQEYDGRNIFDADEYANGAPSLMLALYDTVRKYNTKADILSQGRSFNMHLKSSVFADLKDFNVNPNFIKAVENEEAFSTIDHEYDPMLPVVITDKAVIVHPLDWSSLFAVVDGVVTVAPTYSYDDVRNSYVKSMYMPLLWGIYDWLNEFGSKIYGLLPAGLKTMSIPIYHSTSQFSMWSLIVTAATKYIITRRRDTFLDVDWLRKSNNMDYYSGLVNINVYDFAKANKNFTFTDIYSPLKTGVLNGVQSVKWILPELFFPWDETAGGFHYLLPWYFNESMFDEDGVNSVFADDPWNMTMFSIRKGATLPGLLALYDISERDLRLSLDKMVVPPLGQAAIFGDDGDVFAYKYGATSDGLVSTHYADDDFTIGAYLSTPRELGFVMDAPGGYITPRFQSWNPLLAGMEYDYERADFDDAFFGVSSYRMFIYYSPERDLAAPITLFGAPGVNVQRGSLLNQNWFRVDHGRYRNRADGDVQVIIDTELGGHYYLPPYFGMHLSAHDIFSAGGVLKGFTQYAPFTELDGTHLDTNYITSLQNYLWFRLQRLPFVLNPFDCAAFATGEGVEDSLPSDPFDFAYMFGVAGSRASDFNEDIQLRLSEQDLLGRDYVESSFLKASPLFK